MFWLYTRVLMMQFINTFEGVKTRCVYKPDQTLFSATTNKNGKKAVWPRETNSFGTGLLFHFAWNGFNRNYMASFRGLLILAVLLLLTVEVFTESTNSPGGCGEVHPIFLPIDVGHIIAIDDDGHIIAIDDDGHIIVMELTINRLHTVNNCSLDTTNTTSMTLPIARFKIVKVRVQVTVKVMIVTVLPAYTSYVLKLAIHASAPTRTAGNDVIRGSGSPPSLGDKYSIFLAVWYIYESSVKKGDYGILAMEQLILEKIYLARDDLMPAKNEVLWKEPCFWKSTHHQRCILNFCAGFVYGEVTRWINMIYMTTRNMIFTLVLLLQGMKELLFCFLMVLFLQIQFLKKSNNHLRCVVNMCARFSHHDECWGFASSGEWLSLQST